VLVGLPMGSRGFATITPLLAEHFAVVTYDPRGILRSTAEGPDAEVTLDLLADDVHHLLAALVGGLEARAPAACAENCWTCPSAPRRTLAAARCCGRTLVSWAFLAGSPGLSRAPCGPGAWDP
jgi:hypothetical protein